MDQVRQCLLNDTLLVEVHPVVIDLLVFRESLEFLVWQLLVVDMMREFGNSMLHQACKLLIDRVDWDIVFSLELVICLDPLQAFDQDPIWATILHEVLILVGLFALCEQLVD